MEEKVGKIIIELDADMNDFKSALQDIKTSIAGLGDEAKRSTGGFDMLSSVVTGSFIGGTLAAASGIGKLIDNLVNLAANTPEVALAQAELDEEFRLLGDDVAPIAAAGLELIGNSVSWIRENAIPDIKEFIAQLEVLDASSAGEITRDFVIKGGEWLADFFTVDSKEARQIVELEVDIVSGVSDFFESFFGGDNFVSSLADAFVSAVDRLRADGGGGGGAI